MFMEELIKELLDYVQFPEKGQVDTFNFQSGDVQAEYTAKEDEVVLKLKKVKPSFYDYLDSIEDDLFQEVCAEFSKKVPFSLKDFDAMIKAGKAEKEQKLFAQTVKEVAAKRIENLKKYVG